MVVTSAPPVTAPLDLSQDIHYVVYCIWSNNIDGHSEKL